MKSTTFRIVPVLPDVFHVQEKRRFWPGWIERGETVYGICASFFQPYKFATQQEAKLWIAGEIDRRAAEAKHMATPHVYVHVDA